jgi:hypothetical protein
VSALLHEAPAPDGLTRSTSDPLLTAAGPGEWFATHLAAHQNAHAEHEDADGPQVWVGLDDLLTDGAVLLADTHRRVLAGDGRGGSAQMAAKWVLSWTAGPVAAAVGHVLGTGAAGLLVDRGPVRLRLHPDGWVDRVDPGGCPVAVTPEHPWAGQDGVVVAADETELVRLTVDSLVAALRPVVDAVRGLARVGARALWAEVADELGLATTYQPYLPGREDVVARLRAAVTAPGAPWRVSPTLRTTTAPWGEVYVGQKGGCCLAYQRPSVPVPEDEMTDDLREYHARFERALPDGKHVCNTCSLRDAPGCEERQLFWLERRR